MPKVQDALSRVKDRTRKGMSDEEYDLLLSLLKTMLCNLGEQGETEG